MRGPSRRPLTATAARARSAGAARRAPRSGSAVRGQATLEMLALVPLVLAVALAVAQLFVSWYAGVLAGNAAEAGALALAGGGDARPAARAALHGWSRARAEVTVSGGEVRVELDPPTLLPALDRELAIAATARVEDP